MYNNNNIETGVVTFEGIYELQLVARVFGTIFNLQWTSLYAYSLYRGVPNSHTSVCTFIKVSNLVSAIKSVTAITIFCHVTIFNWLR